MRKKLKDVCDFYSGTGFPTKYQGETEGEYPFYKVGDIAKNATAGKIYLELCNNYISSDVAKKIKGCILPKDTVVFAKIGETLKLNRRAITSCDCLIDNNAMGIAPRLDLLRIQYFYFFMKRLKMQTLAESTTVPSVRKAVLEAYEIEVPSLAEQEEIEKKLALMQKIIKKRRQELSALDELVNARFVEMFGDPIINSLNLNIRPMTEICEIIDGDRGKNYPKIDEFSEEGYCLFLNAKNVTSDGFNFENCMFVSKEKDETLRKGKLLKGDVVLTTRGTIGNIAFYTEEVPFEHMRINSGMVILRMKKEVVNQVFFMEQFKMQLMDIKEKIASGSAQPQLPISTMNKIEIILPAIEEQNQFADFVYQIDKSKLLAQIQLKNITILLEICSIIYTNTNGNGEGTI